MPSFRKRVRGLCAVAAAAIVLAATSPVAHAQKSPEDTVKSFEIADGLEATVWAAEPMLINPTNIDVDSRGRVWVCEGANYRTSIKRPEGDRIVILEDTDHDGKADSQNVFVQDTKLKSPLGVCVLGSKVYVSLSPNILVYTIDETGDKPVGPPEVWMTGFEGAEHDHGVHTLTFGPDGRIYFNSGNAGTDVKEPFKWGNGKPVVDSTGSSIPRGPMWRGTQRSPSEIGYQEGMAFRTNADGTGFETIAHNFRNNYELATDSFGTVWQSDNDDDGNEGVRINYVMEGGNFGYHGPEGHDWQRDQAAFPGQSRQQAHWHQKWPGVVPNMLQTGGGSPTGIVVYEGDLLPEKFRGALIHCDAGPNVVRAYIPKATEQVPTKKFTDADNLQGPDRPGAGYTAEVVNIIKGGDKWFRPSDVCVAPDGSLLIADWYDPGVGGHQTADQPKNDPPDWHKLRGRIYRVAPKGNVPASVKLDLLSTHGQLAAIKSPNMATRYLGYAHLKGSPDAEPMLAAMFAKDANPRFRARALWLLETMPDGAKYIAEGLKDKDADIRITAFRAARQAGLDVIAIANTLADDASPAVRREVALAMNYQPADKAVPILVKLANQYDGEDRWYLEAIGIGAIGKEDALLAAWEQSGTNKSGKPGEMIRWRLKKEPPAPIVIDEKIQSVSVWWIAAPFESTAENVLDIDFGPDKHPGDVDPNAPLSTPDGKSIKWQHVSTTPYQGVYAGLKYVNFRDWCEAQKLPSDHVVGYFATKIVSPVDQTATMILGSNDGCRIWLNGAQVLDHPKGRALRYADDKLSIKLKSGANVLLVKLHNQVGPSGLLVAVEADKQKLTFGDETTAAAAAASTSVAQTPLSPEAAAAVAAGKAVSKDGVILPAFDELAKLSGDAKAGEAVFANAAGANCISCHQIGAKGQMLGPPLSTVGQKLNKAQLYEAILKPSAGILMGYESWVVKTKKGDVISGLKTSETANGITIKDTKGQYHDIATADIARQVKQKISIMPEGLSQTMTKQELVDLVEYLTTLKNKN
jgi:putative membrane-bound dehydrogenase-like protein